MIVLPPLGDELQEPPHRLETFGIERPEKRPR